LGRLYGRPNDDSNSFPNNRVIGDLYDYNDDDDNDKYDYINKDKYKNNKRIIYSIENYEKSIFNGIINNSNTGVLNSVN
jgi:hypothetical protein